MAFEMGLEDMADTVTMTVQVRLGGFSSVVRCYMIKGTCASL